MGVLGIKGGVGTTMLATNIAAALSKKDPTILGDIRPGQGSLGLSLGFGRSSGMANLIAKQPTEITSRVVENELVTHSSGLKMLLSSARPKEAQITVNLETTALVVRTLKSISRNVVLDLGAGISRHAVRLVKELDMMIMVVEPTRVALNMGRELLKEFEAIGMGQGKMGVVIVNRTQSTIQVPWQEAEQILGQEMLGMISPAPELAFQAAEAGFPLVLFQPAAIAATQITKLANEIGIRSRPAPSGERNYPG
jgi:Flp pilus assembly CpaE family ATPase